MRILLLFGNDIDLRVRKRFRDVLAQMIEKGHWFQLQTVRLGGLNLFPFVQRRGEKSFWMSDVALNKTLKEMGIQYKVGQTWGLATKYQNMGQTDTQTYIEIIGDETRSSYKLMALTN